MQPAGQGGDPSLQASTAEGMSGVTCAPLGTRKTLTNWNEASGGFPRWPRATAHHTQGEAEGRGGSERNLPLPHSCLRGGVGGGRWEEEGSQSCTWEAEKLNLGNATQI